MDTPLILGETQIRLIRAGKKRRLSLPVLSTRRHGTIHKESTTRTAWCDLKEGDRLWVQEEAFIVFNRSNGAACRLEYAADLIGGRPHLHGRKQRWGARQITANNMERGDSRLTLTVASARLHKLHDLTAEDIAAEGIEVRPYTTIADYWSSYNVALPWALNPEVVGVCFAFMDGNIDKGPRLDDAPAGNALLRAWYGAGADA